MIYRISANGLDQFIHVPDGAVQVTVEQQEFYNNTPGAVWDELQQDYLVPVPPEPTEAELVDELKQQLLQELYNWYGQKVCQGFTPTQPDNETPYSFALKLTQDALELWNKDLSRVNAALQLGDVEENEEEYFYDAVGTVRSLPTAEYVRVLARLGKYFKNEVWAITETVKAQIEAATTTAALEAIQIPTV